VTTAPVAAVTGGTGFLGRYIVAALAGAGWKVRLLTRRDPAHPLLDGLPLELVPGALDDPASLSRLVRGAAVVIHAAGLVKARSREEFMAVNRDGSGRLAGIVARDAPQARFILVSSQAARSPGLSPYAESKRAGETAAIAALGDVPCTVLRPCVIYGPWDYEGQVLLRVAQRRIAPVTTLPEPQIAMIHARDAAAAVVSLSRAGPSGAVFELSDEQPEGYAWSTLLRAIGTAQGRVPHLVPMPDRIFWASAAASDLMAAISGRAALFGRGKISEILSRDWSSDPARQPPAALWTPQIGLAGGLKETVAWWRQAGTTKFPPDPR